MTNYANSTSSRLLAVRSLNATRRIHEPTYVATRFLLDSSTLENVTGWIEQVLPSKYSLRSVPRFFRILKFKQIRQADEKEYRLFLVPSPTTSLTEAVVLDSISKAPSFSKPSYVYSYKWPKPWSPYNFEHYINCYRDRNRDIADHLANNRAKIAVIADVKTFYDHIPHETVRSRFEQAIESSDIPAPIKAAGNRLVDHLLSFSEVRGIATGPELSHVLADLVLQRVDEEMSRRFPSSYFRYVDDIVILANASERTEAEQLLADLLAREGLSINPYKTDHVSSEEWVEHGPQTFQRIHAHSFRRLVFRIKCFLAIHPGRAEDLERALLANGFQIPLKRIQATAQRKSFAIKLMRLIRKGWTVALNALFDDEGAVVNEALKARQDIKERLTSMLQSDIPTQGTRRRWYVQRLRYLINRALYLLPLSDLGFFRAHIDSLSEFAETSALLDFLVEGKIEPLLEMPGTAVSTAGSFARQLGLKWQSTLPSSFSKAAIHSFGVLLLHGACQLPASTLPNLTDAQRRLLLFCAGQAPSDRELNNFTFLDEIRTLQIGRNSNDALEALDTRFANNEETVFEGLTIGDHYQT